MNIIKNSHKSSFLLVLFSIASWSLLSVKESKDAVPKDSQGALPIITIAKATSTDPYYPYAKRPKLSSRKDLPKDLKARTAQKINHVPWTLLPPSALKKSELFKLKDIVVDRIKDPKTGKNYIKLYHGTTSDFVDIFKGGAKVIRFDVAELTALGMGFYLTANLNEAKSFACSRYHLRKDEEDLAGSILVVGVLDDDRIKGTLVKPGGLAYSNKETGEPLDKNIYFGRNKDSYNQFLFFSNIAPYLKIFRIVTLPSGFGKGKTFRDQDGLPTTSTEPDKDKSRICKY